MSARARGLQALRLNEFSLLFKDSRCAAARWLILVFALGVITGAIMASPEQPIDDGNTSGWMVAKVGALLPFRA